MRSDELEVEVKLAEEENRAVGDKERSGLRPGSKSRGSTSMENGGNERFLDLLQGTETEPEVIQLRE